MTDFSPLPIEDVGSSETKHIFKSSIEEFQETIRKAESEMNKRLLKENFVSANEFFNFINEPKEAGA